LENKKTSRFSEIRATAFDAVVIMRQIGNPGVLESLTNVRDTISKVNETVRLLQSPEMVKNIENFRIISDNINDSSARIESTVKDLKETGVIDKTSALIDSAKKKVDSFGTGENNINGEDLHNVVSSTQEMFASITALVNELAKTVVSSKKSETITNIHHTIKDASEIYKTATSTV